MCAMLLHVFLISYQNTHLLTTNMRPTFFLHGIYVSYKTVQNNRAKKNSFDIR